MRVCWVSVFLYLSPRQTIRFLLFPPSCCSCVALRFLISATFLASLSLSLCITGVRSGAPSSFVFSFLLPRPPSIPPYLPLYPRRQSQSPSGPERKQATFWWNNCARCSESPRASLGVHTKKIAILNLFSMDAVWHPDYLFTVESSQMSPDFEQTSHIN